MTENQATPSASPSRLYVAMAIAATASVVLGMLFMHPPAPRIPRPGEQLAAWESACEHAPPDADACARAGTARLYGGDEPGAKILAGKSLAADANNLHAQMLEAAIAQADGDLAGARAKYEAAEKAHPLSGLPASNLAMLALASHDMDGAEEAIARALKIEPGLANAHATHAQILGAKGQTEEALNEIEFAIGRDPLSVPWNLIEADLLAQAGRFEIRLELFRKLAKVAPDNLDVRLGYGQTLEEKGRYDLAVEQLRLADEVSPDDPRVQVALARVYLQQGKPDFAEPRLARALTKAPHDFEARFLLAKSHEQRGQADDALAELDALISEKGAPRVIVLRARKLRARILIRQQKTEDAQAELGKILELDADALDAHASLGRLLLQRNDYDGAKPHLEKALTGAQVDPDAMFDYARILAHEGKVEPAMERLDKLEKARRLSAEKVEAMPEFRPFLERPDMKLLLWNARHPMEVHEPLVTGSGGGK